MGKESLEFKDDFIESLVKSKEKKMLSDDFDIKLMHQIQLKNNHKKEVLDRLNKSMFSLFIGILLILIYSIIVILDKKNFGIYISTLGVFTLFIITIITFVFAYNYKRILKNSFIFN